MLAFYSILSVKCLDHTGNYKTEKPLIQLFPSNTEFQVLVNFYSYSSLYVEDI